MQQSEGSSAATAGEIARWLAELARSRARTVLPVPGGHAVLHDGFPQAHDHNRLVVTGPCAAPALAAAADQVLAAAGCAHRLVDVLDADLADDLWPALRDAGWSRDDVLVQVWRGPAPADPPDGASRVEEIDLDLRSRAATDSWREDLPEASPEVWEQLGTRAATVADRATWLGVLAPDGSVAGRADLYLHGGLGQVEDVVTRPADRGRGIASALVLSGVDRALRSGATTVFLLADADDRPQQLYRRLGFVDLARHASFRR